jgi:predicted ester cyclase
MTPADFEEFKMLHSQYRNAFPDYHYAPEIILAKGDTVVTIGTVTATHIANFPAWIFKGITPTGKQLQWKEIWVNYFKDGKVVGGYMLNDQLEILRQLGINCPAEEVNETE